MSRNITNLAFLLVFASGIIKADSISGVTSFSSFGANDMVAWGQVGQPFDTFTGGINTTSAGGIQVGVMSPSLERVDEGFGWIGIFASGDQLLWNEDTGKSITFTFGTPILGVGAFVQGDAIGAFSMTVTAFDGATNLGSFSVNGNNTLAEDNSAPFLGVTTTTPMITSVVFSELDPSGSNQFALDTLELSVTPSGVTPEPGSASMIVIAALLGVLCYSLRSACMGSIEAARWPGK